jgi:hypothetical protein
MSSDERVEAKFKVKEEEEEEESEGEDKDCEDEGGDWPLHDVPRALHDSGLLQHIVICHISQGTRTHR